jgi:tetratricopeptide (TPR) repeat protein
VNELEEERDFLLRSLDDLEREHDAGDVDDTDYATLRDDYTARAAAAIRTIEAKQAAAAPARAPRSWGRTIAWVAGIVVFAVLAGVLVARMSGSRRDSETATGDVRDSTRQLIVDATNAAQRGEYDDAIALFTDALDLSPSDTEALTYRGWARFQKGGDDVAAMADVDDAISLDPAYPDARVFKAIMLVRAGDFAGANAQMRVFDSLDAPAFMVQVIEINQLRQHIVAGVLLADGAPGFVEAGFTADDVFAAAQTAAERDVMPADAIELLDLVLAADPNDADAHAYKGYTLARVGVPAGDANVTAAGLAEIDAALAIDPLHAAALAYRAFTLLYGNDDAAGAKASLDAFDALADKPADIVAIIDGTTLRDDLEAALQQ